MTEKAFQQLVRQYYHEHKREMPWRETVDPYKILISEVMLQQTQVSRVIPKYELFLERFPTVSSLAKAPLGEVLKIWSGLGYNRRAKYLWQAAKVIHESYDDKFPATTEELIKLPGVGKNTAGAIMAYSFNEPVVFAETNIRSVYIHHFFADRTDVADSDLLPIVESTLDTKNPREWYLALMDYGSYLKTQHPNPSRKSSHHVKQSVFAGSNRQLRGWILRQLAKAPQTKKELMALNHDTRLAKVLRDLQQEGLIQKSANRFSL